MNACVCVDVLGIPSQFLTVSPDDVHNLLNIRLSYANRLAGSFPSVITDEFVKALESGGTFEQHGYDNIDLGSVALKNLVNVNPVAASEAFFHELHAIVDVFLRTPDRDRYRSSSHMGRTRGIFGTAFGTFLVVEVQGRGALHFHLLHWSAISPLVLQQLIDQPDMVDRLRDELQTMFQADLPPQYHIQHATMKAFNALKPAHVPPRLKTRPLIQKPPDTPLLNAQVHSLCIVIF